MPSTTPRNGRGTQRKAPTRRKAHAVRTAYAQPRRQPGKGVFAIAGMLAVAAAIAVGVGGAAGQNPAGENGDGAAPPSQTTPAPAPEETRMSFLAVGDSLPEISIGAFADAQSGDVGDGSYDYGFIFEHVKDAVQAADVAYIDQEVHIGGAEIGPRGYPSFSTTDEIADAIVDAGFDLVASATNHAYDWGPYGVIEHSRSIWNSKPVLFTGTATSAEEATEIPVYEGDLKVAFLNYTYGVNAYEESDFEPYTINFIGEDRIRSDVARAHELADVIVVAMHWGTENQLEPDDYQMRYAQLLADLEVDVVVGSHPHVIGQLEWVEGASGHKTLVAYSLGNFVSHHEAPLIENELEGMLACDFVRDSPDGDVRIENVTWTPLVNHSASDNSSYTVYPLKDYTPELASQHRILAGLDDPIAQMRDITRQVIGGEFAIDDGSAEG